MHIYVYIYIIIYIYIYIYYYIYIYVYVCVCELLYIQILNVDFVFITFSQMLLGKSKTRFPAVTLMVSPASWSSV